MRSSIIVGLVSILSLVSFAVGEPTPVARAHKHRPSHVYQARSPRPSNSVQDYYYEKRAYGVDRHHRPRPSPVYNYGPYYEKRATNVERAYRHRPSNVYNYNYGPYYEKRATNVERAYRHRPSNAYHYYEARAPAPAPAPSYRHGHRRPRDLEKREQEPLSQEESSSLLCPVGDACPVSGAVKAGSVKNETPRTLLEWTRDGFECVDFKFDLTSCGGCGSIDSKFDCTAITGSKDVSCDMGTCQVQTCEKGFTRSADGKSCEKSEKK